MKITVHQAHAQSVDHQPGGHHQDEAPHSHRMGGVGVSPAMERQIAAFIDSQLTPDNPHKSGAMNEQQTRGLAVYVKAQCNTCHKGETLTDNSFVDVGTFVKTGPLVDDLTRFARGGLNTPSLLGIASGLRTRTSAGTGRRRAGPETYPSSLRGGR